MNRSRRRALDKLETSIDSFLDYNPLFQETTSLFNEAFDKGTRPNLKYYMNRNGVFEETFCDLLIGDNVTQRGNIWILTGQIGSGKTTFSRYLCEKLIPSKYNDAICIYLDSLNISNEKQTNIEASFVRAAVLNMATGSNSLFQTQYDLYKELLVAGGYIKPEQASPSLVFEMGRKLNAFEMLGSLLSSIMVKRVLIIFDNYDETSLSATQAIQHLANELSQVAQRFEDKICSILIPLREYTKEMYWRTDYNAVMSLPEIDQRMVIASKFDYLQDILNERSISFDVNYEIPRHVSQKRRIVITKSGLDYFVKRLRDQIFSEKFFPNVCKLSAQNNRVLATNIYNMIHSVKLPLTGLYQKCFIPVEAMEYQEEIPFGLALECLMAIHYSFYDTKSSLIMNMFNVSSILTTSNFQNTMIIVRLISIIRSNKNSMMLEDIKTHFSRFGYLLDITEKALKKCVDYGLLSPSTGLEISHWNNQTVFRNTTAAEVYLYELLTEPSYLQYVCEDTPMQNEFVIDIEEKYSDGGKELRIKSAENLLDFIALEESFEINFVKENTGISETEYIRLAGIPLEQQKVSLTEYMTEKLKQRFKNIRNSGVNA